MSEQKDIARVSEIALMEQFYSLQGEGFHQGRAAYFVRLAGCDVGCSWCDVKESWTAAPDQMVSVEELVNQIQKSPAEIVVITGGEPLMQDLWYLTKRIQALGKRTHLETSGAHPLSGIWDWICLSPKRFKKPLDEVLYKADELKVVVYHPNDLRWAEEYAAKMNSYCMLYLQAEWSKSQEMLPIMVEYVKANPKWRICLQTHKYLQIP